MPQPNIKKVVPPKGQPFFDKAFSYFFLSSRFKSKAKFARLLKKMFNHL